MTMDQLVRRERAPIIVHDDFRGEVINGLSQRKKTLPSRFFYDDRGSELFEAITELPEYYPTRTEIGLLKQWSNEIGKAIPGSAVVVEFGSGSSRKTELLLSALNRPCAYIPIEISAAALYPAARRIAEDFPEISVHPILGGFHDLKKIRLPLRDYPYLGFFPGSTIGNLTRAESILFLKSARQLLGGDASFLIGVDLKKPLDILLPAYDDAQGVTAAFNCNILTRINRELDGTFDLSAFDHQAIYNESEGRIEMHLRSKCVQAASVGGHVFQFQSGETIHTENSYKYTVAEFHALAQESDWSPIKTWIDKNSLFSLHLLA